MEPDSDPFATSGGSTKRFRTCLKNSRLVDFLDVDGRLDEIFMIARSCGGGREPRRSRLAEYADVFFVSHAFHSWMYVVVELTKSPWTGPVLLLALETYRGTSLASPIEVMLRKKIKNI